ncbi:hypothetical protein CHRY9390_01547 [Chryseobacterium aquaeductus]|uniref:LPXTG-motif cell wall-anchored protein n=2 Tax=Chryseobacterium aquaeductus TaxID=2675056 RepID=A0A9N8MFK3_9FLAO|nr:hypothetical protein CHRY9390_01547 [Chryseobacterium potabilaquae]CAD7806695.1 hypothetical protein CHRY9390_01547 [Chryseobacterium aquaeductus]
MELKKITTKMQSFALTIFALFFSILTFAQDDAVDTKVSTSTTTTTTEEWYTNPTYIIIGAVLFIVLVAVLVRGGRERRD